MFCAIKFIVVSVLALQLNSTHLIQPLLRGADETHARLVQRGGEEVFITEIELARDDGAGRAGRVVKTFRRTDNPLHCVVTLSRAVEGTRVRFVWTAIEAGDKRDEVLSTAEVVTTPREIIADGLINLPREWPTGKYKVQATVNGRVTKTIEFRVE